MMEHIAQMVPMLLLAGLLAGWMAEATSRARGFGFIPDMTLGLAGSLAAGTALWVVGSGAGMLMTFAIGYAGAAVALVAQRTMWASRA